MAVINSRAEIIQDGWTYFGTDVDLNCGPNHVVPSDVLAQAGNGTVLARPMGVYVSAGVMADQIAPLLSGIDLVMIEFPKFRDGRGFTIARALREKHEFHGDIRAIGHVLPDQFAALIQCGFSTIVTPAEHPPAQWRDAANLSGTPKGPLLRRLISQRTDF